MFVAKVCSEQIREVHEEFIKENLNAEIQPGFIIEIYEPKSEESRIKNIISNKNLPVFLDMI